MIEYTFINDLNEEIIIYAYNDNEARRKLGTKREEFHCIRVQYVD